MVKIDALNAWCRGDVGAADSGTMTILGKEFAFPEAEDNSQVAPNPFATIKFHQTTKHADGDYTLTAIVIDLGLGTEVLKLGTVHCD